MQICADARRRNGEYNEENRSNKLFPKPKSVLINYQQCYDNTVTYTKTAIFILFYVRG